MSNCLNINNVLQHERKDHMKRFTLAFALVISSLGLLCVTPTEARAQSGWNGAYNSVSAWGIGVYNPPYPLWYAYAPPYWPNPYTFGWPYYYAPAYYYSPYAYVAYWYPYRYTYPPAFYSPYANSSLSSYMATYYPPITTSGYARTTSSYTPSDTAYTTTTSTNQSSSVLAVDISDSGFNAETMTVKVGTTIRWTNNGKSNHTVTSSNDQWDSATLAPGQSFSAIFTQPGIYNYHCSLHKEMRATIIVK
jgi:plastocyanin